MEGPTPGPLLVTGIPNLDLVLGGGVPEGDVLLVVGPAGAGKTTLSLQMLFHAAASGQNVLYVATLSEPPSKLLRHLRSYTFYDERFIGKRLFVLNIYPLLTQSLDALTDALVSAVKEHRATFVVVDGVMTIHDLHPESSEFRQFVYELGAVLATQGCTTVVTSGEIPRDEEYRFPEFTMADGVVELGTENVGTRTLRTLRVRKLRGLAPLLGQHVFRIDNAGIKVFPRPESVIPMANVGLSPARVSIGLPELDTLMHGGPHQGSITLLAGSLGTGKTLTCLEFLMDGVKQGEKGLLVGFRETPRQLLDKARAFGLDLRGAVDEGRVVILQRRPVDLLVEEMTWEMRQALEQLTPVRFALDSIAELEHAVLDPRRVRGYMATLAELLQNHGVTSLITKEVAQVIGPELDFSDTPLAMLAQNLLLYRWVEFRGDLYRIVSILKMRDSAYDSSIRQYQITETGIHVLEKVESAEGLLTGIAHLPSEARTKRPFR